MAEWFMALEAHRFPMPLAGNLSLDFTNTVEFRTSENRLDFLHSYEHVLAWCWKGKLVGEDESERLRAAAAIQPKQAQAAYRAALDLRDTIYRVFTALIDDALPPADDLDRLNELIRMTPRQVTPVGDHFAWAWAKSDDLAQILAPIALSAGELLTSEQVEQVRQCPNCGWLFVDTSRNHSRRWCSMDFCGSKVKSRRQYERRKAKDA